jgi:hypothetical protein
MPLVLADRVKDTTTTTGTGTITLSGTAPIGYVSFGTAIGNANTTYYTITAGSEWEVGIGTYTASGTTLSRDTVLASSAGGTTKVTFSAGTKDVFVTYPAGKAISDGYGTLPATNGGTGLTSPGTSGNVLVSNGTTWTSGAAVAYPQNIQSANYTLVLGDAGKQIFHPVADAFVRTYTIPANASVAFPIGTVVLFTVENGGTPVGININSDTLVFGDGTTGSLGVVANQTLMAIKVTATKWMANYLYQTGTPTYSGSSIIVAHDTAPFVSAYTWNSTTGFGTKYANPSVAIGSTAQGVMFSPAGNAVAVTEQSSPRINAYAWTVGSGFGTKYADPATLPTGLGYGVAFSPASNAIAVAHDTTPFVTAYPWSASTGFGAKYTNPATLPAGTGLSVTFNPAGDAVAIGHLTTPFITAYPWTVGSGFGTKYANPATLAPGGAQAAFSPAGNAIAMAHELTPFVSAWPWSGAGFGTKYANPATLPTGTGRGIAFNPSATAVAVSHSTTPFVSVYAWTVGSGFGTKFANPATLPPSPASLTQSAAFNAAGDALALTSTASPYINAYPWSGAGFGTKYANPATLPTGAGSAPAFTPN